VVVAGHYNLVGFPLFERHSGIGPARKARYDAALVKPRRMENKRMHDISPSICTHAINGDYLDIETNSFREIAVVGLYGHGGFTSLIRGESLTRQRLCDELAQYDLLITFNGTSFDLPLLLAMVQELPLYQPHNRLLVWSWAATRLSWRPESHRDTVGHFSSVRIAGNVRGRCGPLLESFAA
jgi:hypothetical protein